MDIIPFNIQELWQVLKFLASENGLEPDKFVTDILEKIHEQEEKMNNLVNLFSSLDDQQKKRLLNKLDDIVNNDQKLTSSPTPSEQSKKEKKYLLTYLKDKEAADLVKRKPQKLWINNIPFDVKNWKEVTINFVKTLLSQNLINSRDLPFYPNSSSGKAYLNSFPRQPNASYDGLFEKVDDNIYVDIKYNAKYHLLNIWRTLEKLGLQDKWNVEVELRE